MRKVVLIVCLITLIAGDVMAESPRFRGPAGDGKFVATGLMKEWPEAGPQVLWTAEGLGEGYSSVSVADGKLYVSGVDGEQNGILYVLSLEGERQAQIPYGKETVDDWAPGPRATPTIDGNRAYLLSGPGTLYAFDLDANSILWQVDILNRFAGGNITWQMAESLLVDGNKVFCTPGGEQGVVVALDKMTGETVWTMTEIQDKASYCAPVIITHNGHRILVTMTAANVLGMDPETGALLWNHGHTTKYDIHAVSPVYEKGLLYYSSGCGSGGGALVLSDDGGAVVQKWSEKTLDCQHHGVVLVDGYIYGTAQGRAGMVCLELDTGKVMWNSREISQGSIVYADGMLYVYEGPKAGKVSLITPSPQGLDVKGRFTVTAGTEKHWPHPTIAQGMLLIRRGDAVIAYDIREK